MAIIEYDNGICRDTNVLGNNVYMDNGQGCGTVWYSSVKQAAIVFEIYEGAPSGHDANLCHMCKCHYSINDPKYKKALYENACQQWKKKIASGDPKMIDKLKGDMI